MRSAVVLLLVPLCRASTNATASRRLNVSPSDRLRLEHPTLRKRAPSRATKGQISDEDKAALLSAPSPSSAAVPARVALPPRRGAAAGASASIPSFMYGTAWKEARTAMLARLALDKVGGGGAARAFSPPLSPASRLRARALSLARAAFFPTHTAGLRRARHRDRRASLFRARRRRRAARAGRARPRRALPADQVHVRARPREGARAVGAGRRARGARRQVARPSALKPRAAGRGRVRASRRGRVGALCIDRIRGI